MDIAKYIALRLITLPFVFIPFWMIHKVGDMLGFIAYHLMGSFRKRALSNLALATDLKLSNAQIKKIAIGSFQNLMITCLEYAKFACIKDIHSAVRCKNPEVAQQLMNEGQGVIFFCGHQANWEVLFLEGTSRMPGVAIGKPVKNRHLYQWVLSIRQKFGGTIITPKNAIKEGLRALKQGKFLGIVGDQGMPDSGFNSSFFGRMAWTSPVPAMLSYRTARPIIVATTVRENGGYTISYSDPIWPDLNGSMQEQIPVLMNAALKHLENTIKMHPEQWLWQHNRWKQQLPGVLSRRFRKDSLCLILPCDKENLNRIVESLPTLRSLYPHEHLTILAPKAYLEALSDHKEEIISYEKEEDLLLDDYRFKLIFNFSSSKKVKRHYKQRASFDVVSFDDLLRISGKTRQTPFCEILRGALCHA